MAKIQIKSEKLTPFGEIFSIMEQFDSIFSPVIDSTLGLRSKQYGYQYSKIIRSLMSVSNCVLTQVVWWGKGTKWLITRNTAFK